MGDRLDQTLYWLVHTRATLDKVSWGNPQLDHWAQNSSHRENHKICALTLECIYGDWASSTADAYTVDKSPSA